MNQQPKEEKWSLIKGFENYAVSTFGRVKNRLTNHILKPYQNGRGYFKVKLQNECGFYAQLYVHRLVAEAFISRHSPKQNEVNHLDCNRANCSVGNLEWVTRKQNAAHKVACKFFSWAEPTVEKYNNLEDLTFR